MIFVITGASSFLGKEMINFLLSEGHQVFAVCRPNSKGLTKLPNSENLKIVLAEMPAYKNLQDQINYADIFINLSWQGTDHDSRNLKDIQEENIRYSSDAIYAASKMGCKLFVESGSQAEYGTCLDKITEETPCAPFSDYGRAKLAIKEKGFELAEVLDIKYLHLRIFSLFGETDHPWTLIMSCLKKMLVNEQVDLSPCTQKWNFLYVKDAVKQICLLIEFALRNGDFIHEVYNIASGDTRILKDFVEEMKALTMSNSKLNYGVVVPNNIVSLEPVVDKIENAIHFISDYSFRSVVNNIIKFLNTKTL